MSPKTNRVVDLFWNILIIGLINFFIDFGVLYFGSRAHEAGPYIYFGITIISTLVLIIASSVTVFIRTKDKFAGKLIYSLIALVLSAILFLWTSFSLLFYLPSWIFP